MTQLDDQAVASTEVDTEVDAAAALYAEDEGINEPEAEPEGEAEEGTRQEDEEPELPAIDMPHGWKSEFKEHFAQFPREVQEYILQRHTEQERFVNSKSQEAAQARQNAQNEYQQQFAQHMQQTAAQLEQYAAMFDVPAPNPQLLYGDESQRALYHQQFAEYQQSNAQRQQAQQQAEYARQQAEQADNQLMQQHAQAEQAKLAAAIPEWNDAAKRSTLLTELQSVGAALDYPPELMAEANAQDILALRTASKWKAAFDREQARNKAKMIPVRAAKGQPKAVAPGTQAGQPSSQTDALAALYPDDLRR